MYLIDVLVEYQFLQQQFTYVHDCFLPNYTRVKIDFNHQQIVGFVVNCRNYIPQNFPLKNILEVIDEQPILNQELVELGNWMSQRYFCSKIAAYQQILPKKLQPKKNFKNPNLVAYCVVLNEDVRTSKQKEAILFLKNHENTTRVEFRKLFKTVADRLIASQHVGIVFKEKTGVTHISKWVDDICYSDDQKNAIHKILQLKAKEVGLLHGVTASGKSEVFFAVIQHFIQKKQQVLLLVPEISLVSQMVKNLLQRFDGTVSLFHSNLNEQEKYEVYQLVQKQEVNIIVGTRSAVFLPFVDLGLIVMDEEHDQSYKQDKNILYQTKEIALKRCEYHLCPLLLASATPSVISYAKAYKGVYQLIEMPNKIYQLKRDIHLIDMKKYSRKNDYILSYPLLEAMKKALQKNEQVVLILNKRGYASYIKCLSCGHVTQCENCDVALKYHQHDEKLKCHICGYEKPYLGKCSACDSTFLTFSGVGTQKLEEYLRKVFKEYQIARLDKDTTTKKHSLTNTLEAFEKGEYQILIGTQMLSKGLDFGNVTVVGIINGDDLLSRESFHSVEQMYQLLVQSFGRSGRKKDGIVFLQVYDTTHYAIQAAIQENYKQFFKQEMNYRHLASYPPYVYLATLMLQNTHLEILAEDTMFLNTLLDEQMYYLGPQSLYRMHHYHRNRWIFKSKDIKLLQEQLQKIYQKYTNAKRKSVCIIDFDTENL